MSPRGGLGKSLDEMFADRAKENAARAGRSRNDALDQLIPTRPSNATTNFSTFGVDPDFGPGYEVLDPAPSRKIPDPKGRVRPRAQKAGYNPTLMVLVIVMRDGKWIMYRGVFPSEWQRLKASVSTNDFVQEVLHAKPWQEINSTQLPRTNPQSFEQGTED